MKGWIEKNTKDNAIIRSPPWVFEAWYISKRAQVVNFWFIPYYEKLKEWKERITMTIGNHNKKIGIEDMEKSFYNLTVNDVSKIKNEYGPSYMITTAKYDFPVSFEKNRFKIYDLNNK